MQSSFTGGRRQGRHGALLLLLGLGSACLPPSIAGADQASSGPRISIEVYSEFIAQAAKRFDIPESWIRAVLRRESAGDVRAVSPKGALGLMQIMPGTWQELRERYDLGRDPYDPRENILAGAAYLKELHERYGSPGFLAAYNAGPRRYEASLAGVVRVTGCVRRGSVTEVLGGLGFRRAASEDNVRQ